MGTVVSLTAAFPGDIVPEPRERLDAASEAIQADFDALERRFSLYREDSEASALARGILRLPHASPEMRDLYTEAVEWRRRTHGAFTAERPDGVLDLSGLVKGRAIAEAGQTLRALGLRDWCLNAGGDVVVSGSPSPSSASRGPRPFGEEARPWLAGVVDPSDRRTLLGAYPLGGLASSDGASAGAGRTTEPADAASRDAASAGAGRTTEPADAASRDAASAGAGRTTAGPRFALATSGSAERGDHIWAVGGGRPEFVQVSVAAQDIVTADVLATAIVAGGRELLDLATSRWDIDALAVAHDGSILATPGFRAPRAA